MAGIALDSCDQSEIKNGGNIPKDRLPFALKFIHMLFYHPVKGLLNFATIIEAKSVDSYPQIPRYPFG